MSTNVMVGTLYSNEGDFTRCKESVKSQTYPCHHEIFSGMDESTGYKTLYKYFKDSKFDYLLKLDADMVLKHNNVVQYLVDKISSSNAHAITHHVEDYFQLMPINGIHFYSQKTEWNFDGFKPFMLKNIDTQTNFAKMKKGMRRTVYFRYPDVLAWHCFWASPKQSFRYGYHRFLKPNHRDSCCNTFDNYIANRDDSRRLACMGMWAASNHTDENAGNYGSEFDKMFNQYCKKQVPERKLAKRIRALNDSSSKLVNW